MALDIMKKIGYEGATVEQATDYNDTFWNVLVIECRKLGHTAYECDQTNHPKG